MKIFIALLIITSCYAEIIDKKIGNYYYFGNDEFLIKCKSKTCFEFNFDKQKWEVANFGTFSPGLQQQVLSGESK